MHLRQLADVQQLGQAECVVAISPGSGAMDQPEVSGMSHHDALGQWGEQFDKGSIDTAGFKAELKGAGIRSDRCNSWSSCRT